MKTSKPEDISTAGNFFTVDCSLSSAEISTQKIRGRIQKPSPCHLFALPYPITDV